VKTGLGCEDIWDVTLRLLVEYLGRFGVSYFLSLCQSDFVNASWNASFIHDLNPPTCNNNEVGDDAVA
jgi:hypothetical protein